MKLFPKRKPYREGYFPVSDGHKLYYALYGNPKGIPVLYVHGGPGGGCEKNSYRHFNPKTFNVLLVDQRGAGKSKPFAETKGNTTQKLVKDFYDFFKFLKIKKAFLFGGSWGSTLSLVYSISHPETVLGMVLRGIYTGSGVKDDYLLNGGPRTHFPEEWERFISNVPDRKNHVAYYWKMMNSPNKKTALHYIREWSLYELSLSKLKQDVPGAQKMVKSKWIIPLAKIEAYYFIHDLFLPKNYIFNNTDKIKNIPTYLVHGRYDFICQPENAYRLHKALPKSKLHFVLAGHYSDDPETKEMMMKEIHHMAKNVKAKNCYF